ncbi:hypothetical protein Ocin01_08161 [Orchesella cincta]|uniref:Uncharacterized protein n=1 Tax=Orchesella cincta TaxID=48709 RepID=A0A1D2MZT6_ORCCI|nr:hypothetical protein Ocin01_08161 [Orchesella cincta]
MNSLKSVVVSPFAGFYSSFLQPPKSNNREKGRSQSSGSGSHSGSFRSPRPRRPLHHQKITGLASQTRNRCRSTCFVCANCPIPILGVLRRNVQILLHEQV